MENTGVVYGDSDQDIGVFESESASPVSFSVDWLEMTRIELTKKGCGYQEPSGRGGLWDLYRCQV